MQQALLDYYQSIIPDPVRFAEYARQPLPATFWVNPLKATQSVFDAQDVTPLPWSINGYRYTGADALGKSWQYQLGLIQIQEEVSMLPVMLLDPKPHETILDLCAAPGNKTAEIAVAMKNTGTVIANDRNYQRMKALGQTMRRLGLINITVTVQDALNYQSFPNYFDKILVDAPCSCEGTFRKRIQKPITPNPRQHRHLASQQIAMLKKAIALCKPGGRIVYSTCTFAPEENEGVVSAILAKYSDEVRLLPIELPNFKWCEGVQQWQDVQYHPDVVHTMRVWPHLNDTGGFYVAVFEKTKRAVSASVATVTPQANNHDIVDGLWDQFDFPAALKEHYIFDQASRRGIYMLNKDHCIPEGLSYDVSGLLCVKTKTNFPKLSTGAVGVLGQKASKNTVTLNEQQFAAYLRREETILLPSQIEQVTATGFVIVCYQEFIAGTGLFLSQTPDQPPRLRSLFPSTI